MAEDFSIFIWQHEYVTSKWKNYTFNEHELLNKAVKKQQKTLTLPSNDPKKKISVNLEKMIQKNLVSGFEQNIRCVISNEKAVCWCWQGDDKEWVSYSPKIAFYLELAFVKKIPKIDIFYHSDYEINLVDFKQLNKATGFIRSICRLPVDYRSGKDSETFLRLLGYAHESKRRIQELAETNISSIHNVIFDLPTKTSATSSGSPLQISNITNIVQALNEELAAQPGPSKRPRFEPIPVDPVCPEADNYEIYCENDDIYKVTLNLASLQANNNKFFIIELLKFHDKNQYAVWFHWGRTGYKGQHNLIEFGSNLDEAKSTFERKFYDKTLNHWHDRINFQRHPSKYDLVFTDFASSDTSLKMPTAESKLDKKLQALLELICDRKKLEEELKELSFDSNATPLGKITAKQVLEGYNALTSIARLIETKGKGKELIEACNIFYTKIPHNFGRKTPPILQTMDDVKEKLKLLEALSNIVLAMNVLDSTDKSYENPIDRYYTSLDCNLVPLEHDSEEFKALRKCLLDTHGPTHNTYKMELVDAFCCSKDQSEKSFKNCGNNKLLWHGSRISNWIGILKKGLQIAPPEAPSTGYMFGKGIYFADISSKSANYCFATKTKNEGILLLSEVSLGNPKVVHHAKNLSKLPAAYDSVVGEGKIRPTSFESTVLSSEALVPCGPLEEVQSDEDFSLFYNEYVIYNTKQVKMKYVLRVKFNF